MERIKQIKKIDFLFNNKLINKKEVKKYKNMVNIIFRLSIGELTPEAMSEDAKGEFKNIIDYVNIDYVNKEEYIDYIHMDFIALGFGEDQKIKYSECWGITEKFIFGADLVNEPLDSHLFTREKLYNIENSELKKELLELIAVNDIWDYTTPQEMINCMEFVDKLKEKLNNQ